MMITDYCVPIKNS